MRSFVFGRAAAVVVIAALAASGCSSGGKASGGGGSSSGGGTGGSGGSPAGSGAVFQGQVAPGFKTSAQWTADLPWSKDVVGAQPLSDHSMSAASIATDQASYGVARVVGGSVVVPSFADGGAAGDVVPTLRFLDAKNGKTIATKALPAGEFLGLTADVVAGQPVAIAQYRPGQDSSGPVTTVFDASGAQVWTSAGQKLGDHQWGAGLVPGDNKAPVFVGGYSVRLNVDPASVDHSKDTYDVLDTTGKSVLQVPVPADQWNLNYVSLVDGYAMVPYDDSLAQTDHSTSRQHFTIYDLAVKAADGSAVASNYELSPLAFTADGSPVFIEVPASGTGITIGVGLGHAG